MTPEIMKAHHWLLVFFAAFTAASQNDNNSAGNTTTTNDITQGSTLTTNALNSASLYPASLKGTEGLTESTNNNKISSARSDAAENGNETETSEIKQQKPRRTAESQNPKKSGSQDSTGMSLDKMAIICALVVAGLVLVGGIIYIIIRNRSKKAAEYLEHLIFVI